mmetsp:Transcript_27780/g.24576  ORF Transcript_27780/g.24576 Transcript_27780/m.24576 type:complete len:247 (+) Transcript_27780:35-775(+)
MLETNEDEEYQSPSKPNYSNAIVLYNNKNTKLDEAQDMLDDLVTRFEAYKKGDFPVPGDNNYIDVDSDIKTQNKLESEDASLKRRLQEQEDNLAVIMKELEEKEVMLKNAVAENNKYLKLEAENSISGEISSQAAAYKFSSMRGNAMKLPRVTNMEIPAEKVIEELPEEDDEEMGKLDEIIQNAQDFNEDFVHVQSQSYMADDIMRANEALQDIERYYEENEDKFSDSDSRPEEDIIQEEEPNPNE